MTFNTLLMFLGLALPLAVFIMAKKKSFQLNFVAQLMLGGIFIWSGFKGAVHFGLMPESTAFRTITLERIDVPQGSVVAEVGRTMQRTAEPIKASSTPQVRVDMYGWKTTPVLMSALGRSPWLSGQNLTAIKHDMKVS